MKLLRRVRAVSLALVLAGAAVMGSAGMGAANHASALTNCVVTDLSIDGEEQAFLTLINQYRAQNGLGALGMSENLNRAASWMAADLAQKGYFSHTDSLGRSPSTRATDCGYPQGAGENLAAGTAWSTAQAAFDAWKASSGHNANMLNSSYRQIGIARHYQAGSQYGWYWVTDFGMTNDGTTAGGANGGTTTPPPPANRAAAMMSPVDGSVLPGSTAAFSWDAGSGARQYFLYVGTSQGANDLYGQSQGLNRSVTVNGLPTNGSTVYARLWTLLPTGWTYQDTQYRAATTTGSGAAGTKAALVSPVAGSMLPAGNVQFAWTGASGGLEYFLYLGTSQGSNNLFGRSQGLATSVTLNVPSHSNPLWARLWTRTSAGWSYTDYQYR